MMNARCSLISWTFTKFLLLIVFSGQVAKATTKLDFVLEADHHDASGFVHGVNYPNRESGEVEGRLADFAKLYPPAGIPEELMSNQSLLQTLYLSHSESKGISLDKSRKISLSKKDWVQILEKYTEMKNKEGESSPTLSHLSQVINMKQHTVTVVNGTKASQNDEATVEASNTVGLFGTIQWGSTYGNTAASNLVRIKLRRGNAYWMPTGNIANIFSGGYDDSNPNQFWYFDDSNLMIRNIGQDLCMSSTGITGWLSFLYLRFPYLTTCNTGDWAQKWKRYGDNTIRWGKDETNAAGDGWANNFLILTGADGGASQSLEYPTTGICWVKYSNADRAGGDILTFAIIANSEDDCLQRCSYAPGCVSLTYVISTRVCWLKKARNPQVQYSASSGVLSYDFFCPQRADWPAGKYLNSDTLFTPVDCPAGKFCPYSALTYTYPCWVGYYCSGATVWPTPCPAGYYCPGSTANPIPCPAGKYCPQYTSDPTYNPCPAGYSCPMYTTNGYQNMCPTAYYSNAGSSSCTWCGNGAFTVYAHWVGGPLQSQCVCDIGWTGNNCEVEKCADVLPGVSLISMLFNADSSLKQYSLGYKDDPSVTFTVKSYLKTLLSVGVDFDGDGNITRSEVTSALKYRSMWAANMQNLAIWCASTTPGAYCYQDISTDKVDVNKVYNDALINYVTSLKHTFDGSGVGILSYISATFPTPSWSNDNCRRYDSSYSGFTKVSAAWDFKTVAGQTLSRVCGYMNGAINQAFTSSDVLKGISKTFVDNVAVSDTASQKRLYCVAINYLLSGGGKGTGFECAVGLFYDGTPVDLFPTLTMNGVIFQYTDTSSGESEFDIFVGDIGTTDEQKKFVVGINYPAISCGRTTQHISFADKENMKYAGQMMEYGIRAIQSINNAAATLTRMTTFAYRIPYLTKIVGDVTTPSGTAIPGVSIFFCHIDALTGENNLDTNFCPLQTFVTDKRGHFEGEIRVSHPKWTNQAEYFNATAKLTETMDDGTVIEHEFGPPFQTIKTGHSFGFSTVEFTDLTTVSVFGSVIFDPNIVAKNRCPLAGIPVMLVDSTGSNNTVYTEADGSFNFSLTRGQPGYVSIPDFNGYTWNSNISTLLTTAPQKAGTRRDLLEITETSSFAAWKENEDVSVIGITPSPPTMSPSRRPTALPTSPTPGPTNIPTSPTSGPTALPTSPTSSPSVIPTSSPTTGPTAPPTMGPTPGPTIIPTSSPTSGPTFIPTMSPTPVPTALPTIHIADGATVQMIHQYTFNDPSYAVKAHDSISNTDANFFNGVSIINGKAKFDYQAGKPAPYIQLPYAILGGFKAVTVECWVDFDPSTHDIYSTLFSFGANPTSLSLRAGFKAKGIYIAVVYNPPAGYSKVYVNGALSQTITIPTNLRLGGSYNLDAFNFIGRNFTDPKTGMDASIDEFRVWYGELDSKMIQSNYRTGVDPSTVSISRGDAKSNIQITFMATSLQPINIGFYGGESFFPLFGPETKVQLVPLDTQCKYSPRLSLNKDTSSITTSIAAMNYTVMLLDAGLPAPLFDASVCDPTRPTITSCFCDRSKSPYQYAVDSGQINQTLLIPEVDNDIIFVNYSYHSGVCYEVTGAEQFSLVEGKVMTQTGGTNGAQDGCFPTNIVVLNQGDVKNVSIFLFELYPMAGFAWFTGTTSKTSVLITSVSQVSIDFNVTNAQVVVKDAVSAKRPQTFDYVYSTYLPNVYARVPVPQGLDYSIKAAGPIFIAPYNWQFTVDVYREGPDGESYTTNTWYILVTGSLANEVPTYYPVATDPTLIYMVLRDPPGGGSSTTFHAGTNLDFSVSIDNLKTFTSAKSKEDKGELGADAEIQLDTAPLGFGIEEPMLNIKGFGAFDFKKSRSASVTRSSNTNYDFSIDFEYDISTSTDPNIAGHASDVIVGGGIDLIVSQAKEVLRDDATVLSGYTCYRSRDTSQWQPGKATTFIFAVYEIEQVIDSLNSVIAQGVDASSGRDQSTIDSLTKQVQNWKTVLTNYRKYNADETAMFTAETSALLEVIKDFNSYEGDSTSDYQKVVNQLLVSKGMSADLSIASANAEVRDKCSQIIPSYQNDHMSNICNAFKTETFTSFLGALETVCTNPNPDAFREKFPYLNQLCQQKALDQSVPIPGGYKKISGTESMFGFLKNKEKYLTFGSDAPFTMSYTSTITQSMSTVSSMEVEGDATDDAGGGFSTLVVAVYGEGNFVRENSNGLTYNLGYTKGSTKSFERTVSATFSDDDMGDYFVVRVTEDPVFGTPIFTTMGGKSKCPGETGTNRRESRVSIINIVDKCCSSTNPSCTCKNLPAGTTANFLLVVNNLSPSWDEVYYTVETSLKFDTFPGLNSAVCGTRGYRAGLGISFSETDLQRIPYNRLVGIPFQVSQGLCNSYNDIEVRIIATCEMPSPNSYVIQYGIKDSKVSYAREDILYASNYTMTFSVSWKTS